MLSVRPCFLAGLVITSIALSASAQESSCGNPFQNHFGPFDYRSASQADRQLVEKVHFTPGVESLTKPATTTAGQMAGDVAYTLHVFPNHHRALLTMVRLGERHRTDQPPGAKFSVDCYFVRAISFRPDDNVARLLYAQYLGKAKRSAEALQQVREASRRAGDYGMSHFNIGQIALDLGDHELALSAAHRAAALGHNITALQERLAQAGQWRPGSSSDVSGEATPAAR